MTKQRLNALSSGSDGLWLCLHFFALPLEVFSRGIEDDAHPAVITDNSKVAWMNGPAEERGIRIGNSMDTAFTLAESVASFERDTSRELSALAQIAGWAYSFTPNVSTSPPYSLLLDISGCMKLFGGLGNLTRKMLDELESMKYSVRFGAANTPLAAFLLAKTGLAPSRFLEAPVTELEIDRAVVESLTQLGMRNLGDILKLPRSGISRRFGVFFADYLARLTGERADTRRYVDPAPRFFSDIVFPANVSNISSVVFPMRRLLGELNQFMTGRQLSTRHLTWTLDHRSHPAKSMNVFTASPENNPDLFFSLTQLQLDKITDVKELDSVSLKVTEFESLSTASGDLFEGTRFKGLDGKVSRSGDSKQEEHLLNMFRARLGPQTCFGLSEANDHRPEKAWKRVRPDVKDYWEPEEPHALQRPSMLLAEPQSLDTRDGRPWQGGPLEIVQGPERIDFGWWDAGLDRDLHRDYYVALNRKGVRLWIYESKSAWFLHGLFA